MAKVKITKSELDRIIKEEALKFKKVISLKRELNEIENELKQLNEEKVEEVTAGHMVKSKGTPFEGEQAKPEFHNPTKNPHTMMEDDEEITDIDTDVDSESEGEENKIEKSEVLKALEDLKLSLNLYDEEENEDEKEEELENNEKESEEDKSSDEEVNSEKEEEGDEIFEFEETEENTEETEEDNEKEENLMESEKKRMSVLAGIIKG